MVYVYAKRLECALTGLFDYVLLILFREKIECLLYNCLLYTSDAADE